VDKKPRSRHSRPLLLEALPRLLRGTQLLLRLLVARSRDRAYSVEEEIHPVLFRTWFRWAILAKLVLELQNLVLEIAFGRQVPLQGAAEAKRSQH
jgi:hypothetical protein